MEAVLGTFEKYFAGAGPVGWGRRIHRLHLCRGVKPASNDCLGYDTKQSDDAVPVMLEL